jgi:hypothetical protein
MTKRDKPETYPRKRVLISGPRDGTDDQKGRAWGHGITAPDLNCMKVVLASQDRALVDDTDYPGLMAALREQASAVVAGDMSRAEVMLANQATALESLFSKLTLRALEQEHMPNLEGFMRLALRAQNQCRATLETLALLKNPHQVVVTRQANISAGPQQVNNLPAQAANRLPRNELLMEAPHGQRLDPGTQGAAGAIDSELAAVGAVNRTLDP